MRLFLKSHAPATADENGILDFLSEFSDWKKKKTENADITETDYLIGIQGKVFHVNNGWGISEILDYFAIGAGRDYAMTALYLGESTKKAVEVATELSIYCEKPIITIRKV